MFGANTVASREEWMDLNDDLFSQHNYRSDAPAKVTTSAAAPVVGTISTQEMAIDPDSLLDHNDLFPASGVDLVDDFWSMPALVGCIDHATDNKSY